jgi:hypothetical protein
MDSLALEARHGGSGLLSQLIIRLKQEDHFSQEFKASLDNIDRPCLKKKKKKKLP